MRFGTFLGSGGDALKFGRRCACWSKRHISFFLKRAPTLTGQVDQVEIVRVVDGRRDLTNLF